MSDPMQRPVCYRDLKTSTQNYIHRVWQKTWDQQVLNKLHSIHPSTSHWAALPVPRHDVRLTRLCIGHTRFTHRHLFCWVKMPQNVPHTNVFISDGWVQLVSKKGRKNRKKDDVNETQSSATSLNKALEANKSDDSSPIEESPKKSTSKESPKKNATKESPKKNVAKESPKKSVAKDSPKKDKTKVETPQNIDSSVDQNQLVVEPVEEKAAKDVGQRPNMEKSKMQNVVVEVSKSDNVEKQLSKEVAAKGTKITEESSKSKKKKKKNAEVVLQENEPGEKISDNISDLAKEQVISETLAPKKSATANSVADSSPVNDKVEENQPSEMKTSNVAFDELAGLYPEIKEQKKKKKVRREH
ncbi:uncharacterized protein TNCV_4915061 [Trichonephila clavipes]|nr:uncharacterized protein TNCV_4915061 [Trichonephila clavipes]